MSKYKVLSTKREHVIKRYCHLKHHNFNLAVFWVNGFLNTIPTHRILLDYIQGTLTVAIYILFSH